MFLSIRSELLSKAPEFQRDSFRLVSDAMNALQPRGDARIESQVDDMVTRMRNMKR